MRRLQYAAVIAMACSSTQAAPGERTPTASLSAVSNLCVTKGALDAGVIREPTVRAFAPGAAGDAAELRFTFDGASETTRSLASGQLRRQVGLKLRAQDSCNVVYVMWRLDPSPKIDVSVKANPGKRLHEECGADGYSKVRSSLRASVPAPSEGHAHVLRAEIVDEELAAWVDGKLVWRGRLPDEARAIAGPAGLRSDNVQLSEVSLWAASGAAAGAACKRHDPDD